MSNYFTEKGFTSLLTKVMCKIFKEMPEDPKSVLIDMIQAELNESVKADFMAFSQSSSNLVEDTGAEGELSLYQCSPSDAINLTPFIKRLHVVPESDLSPPVTPPNDITEVPFESPS